MEEQTIIQRNLFAPSIKVNKGMIGNYGWEIKIEGEDVWDTIAKIKEIDTRLAKEFKSPENNVNKKEGGTTKK